MTTGINAILNQIFDHRTSPVIGKLNIVIIGTIAVGMRFQQDGNVRILTEKFSVHSAVLPTHQDGDSIRQNHNRHSVR